jgi:hypothetical protein
MISSRSIVFQSQGKQKQALEKLEGRNDESSHYLKSPSFIKAK